MYTLRVISALVVLASVALAAPTADQSQNCVQGVLIVATRGSDPKWTDYNTTNPSYADIRGLNTIAQDVITTVGKGSYLKAVPYPATLNNNAISLVHGIDAAKDIVRNYVDACAKKVTPKIVLLGCSQGAQVMSTMLAGGYGEGALDTQYSKHIVAGAIFADPSFVKGVEPLDAGNATKSGTEAKTDAEEAELKAFGEILRSYCQEGDKYCASGEGPDNQEIHDEEVGTYGNAAIKFLNSVLG